MYDSSSSDKHFLLTGKSTTYCDLLTGAEIGSAELLKRTAGWRHHLKTECDFWTTTVNRMHADLAEARRVRAALRGVITKLRKRLAVALVIGGDDGN